jgi:hypothetical protein
MPLLETLTVSLGVSVAKAILKIWIRDSSVGSEFASEIIDVIKSKTTDFFARRNGQRQFQGLTACPKIQMLSLRKSGSDLDLSTLESLSDLRALHLATVAPRNISSLEKLSKFRWVGADVRLRSVLPVSLQLKGVYITHENANVPRY